MQKSHVSSKIDLRRAKNMVTSRLIQFGSLDQNAILLEDREQDTLELWKTFILFAWEVICIWTKPMNVIIIQIILYKMPTI